MKELEDANIQELSKEELMQVQGGMKFWKALLGFALSALIGLFIYS